MSILQEDRIQLLTTINNEAKVRRSTKSLVLGKAKVMSYEDLEEARAKRVAKGAVKEAKEAKEANGKGQRGRKRKSGTPEAEEITIDKVKRGRKRKSAVLETEAEEPEPEPELYPKIARISKAPALSRASMIQIPFAEDEIVPEPWKAPVAQIW